MINLGDAVEDIVTGFKGVAISRTEYLNKCVRIGVQSMHMKDGAPIPVEVFDEECLVVKERAVVVIETEQTGGDRPAVPPRSTVTRK